MKTPPLSCRVFVAVALALTAASLSAQPNAAPPPLGLPRLKGVAGPGATAPFAADRFTVDELSAGSVAGAGWGSRDKIDYLALDAGTEWSRPLRGSGRAVTFISFLLHASRTTIIDIAGARLGLTVSPANGNLQLMYDDSATGLLQWKSFNLHVGAGSYEGKSFAALPTLTVRLDPVAGMWDLYSGSRLLAEGLPLIATKREDRRFVVRAGSEGAWLVGLVMADENPLYEDANANGIDDGFEVRARGGLLAADAPEGQRKLLAQEWRAAQRVKAPPALFVKRPRPDRR